MPSPILTVAEMRAWEDRTWASGITPASVIQRAGECVATAVRSHACPGAPVLVVAGRGHNGDDAAVAAKTLSPHPVTFVRLFEAGGWEAAHQWLRHHRHHETAWVVDGLFGIGLNRPLEGDAADWVGRLQSARIRVLSIDVPSGLDADTGLPLGPAVRADVTLTLGAVKRGLVGEAAAAYVGRLELATDIGLVPAPTGGRVGWTSPADLRGSPPRRPAGGHKGTFGHVAILAGSLGYHGAAVLAAQAAGHARPGLVTVLTEERVYLPVAAHLRAAMVRPWTGVPPLDPSGYTALVIGPGLAAADLPPAWKAEAVRLWREASCPVVADASALDWLPRHGFCPGALRVLTPHPGEAARMLGESVATVQADRVAAADRLAEAFGEIGHIPTVVLKGRHTVVRDPDGQVGINPTGNPGLAQGGTGDVLAGLLGGLLAQPLVAADPGRAVRYGVWLHGSVADRLQGSGWSWTPEDLVLALRDGGSPFAD